MINPSATIDIRNSLEYLDNVKSEIADKALVRALNKTAAQAKVQASKEIRSAGYGIKAAIVKKSIFVGRAAAARLNSAVVAKGKRINLYSYSARQVKAGVTAQVKAKGARTLYEHAFIIKKSNTVFARVVVGGKRVARLPIEPIFGPTVPEAFADQAVQTALIAAVQQKFPAILFREVNFLKAKS